MTGKIMEKLIKLSLPDFAFVSGSEHEKDNILDERIIILHVRSASVIEILDKETSFLCEGVLAYNFSYSNRCGVKESLIAVLHYCATLDKDADQVMIINEIMKPAAQWYCNYCMWEDDNVEKAYAIERK